MSLIISLMLELKNYYQSVKKNLPELFKKWDLEHLQFDEDFDDYLDNDRLDDVIGDVGI